MPKAKDTSEQNSESLQQIVDRQAAEIAALKSQIGVPVRTRLPDIRRALTHKFRIGEHKGYMTVGLFPDGRPGELFITMSKEGSTIGGLMDTVGCLTSIALQYGVSIEMLAEKFSHQRFEPSGWTGNPDIRNASSIIDYVFRWMSLKFVKPETLSPAQAADTALKAKLTPFLAEHVSKAQKAKAAEQAADCPPCQKCGTLMERSGRCHRCPNCGETSGCS